MEDKLEKIFKKQQELDNFIKETKKSQSLDFEYNKSEWIDKLTSAMIAEAVELKEESNWKWWKKPKDINIKEVKNELVDILHFWVSLCLKLGISPEDIFETYMEKNEENIRRQKGGYYFIIFLTNQSRIFLKMLKVSLKPTLLATFLWCNCNIPA